jgi:hypothetical protein
MCEGGKWEVFHHSIRSLFRLWLTAELSNIAADNLRNPHQFPLCLGFLPVPVDR